MNITFLGAARTVTGSCYLIETEKCKFLVDCGMFQGHSKESMLNEEAFPFNPADLDYILLTHAHIDHSGRIPKIYIQGFKGEIITTKATADLCKIMLPDSGHIQEMDNEWTNRKRERAGKPPIKPLYTYQDAVECLSLFKSAGYNEVITLKDGTRIRFNDAGHILGSSIVEIWFYDEGKEVKIVFSGDLGNKDIPILRDPAIIDSADYLVIESTYGNRLHKEAENKVERFVDIINDTIERGGNVVIPSFAVGRTQEIIYELHKQREKYGEKLKKLFSIPVYIDSPLAISATEVFRNNLDCFDEEAREYIQNGDNPLEFPGLQFTRTPEESRLLNEKNENMIIISASGMCDAGRIKHHLKHNLWRKESTILFVGYQAVGTLGRKIVDGAQKVKIFGEEISVNAEIQVIEGFSGHADKNGLLEWIGSFTKKPARIFIVHGEEEGMKEFSDAINDKFGVETIMPVKGSTYSVSADYAIERNIPAREPMRLQRLTVIDIVNKLKEEIDEMGDILKGDLRMVSDDRYVDELNERLKAVEKAIINVLK